ncbi:2'-5' RNA ligase family protein [Arthrobacter sp. CJ23]|uniref:2'-5' RNA ligase family protein n=1 Tax=Arthrobacter sp. CJ23 TaxID=2972479 RepID=UPI00215C05CA|nr:2'-5' RNA ligase family protein [Arthrobacter sp. CJ23]UVJ39701.1 2'-5' RNA ligase family protein [Arthrobacter sp. CJ23]
MRNLILVAFTEPVAPGLVFPRDDWPLHITLLRFDVEPPASTDVVPHLIQRAAAPVAGALGAVLRIGDDAGFGVQGSIPVSLVDHHPLLQGLHEELLDAVEELGGKVAIPRYVLEGYRPHISHHNSKRPKPGDVVVLDHIALVDMAPGGNHTIRKILELWRVPTA